MRIGDRSIEQGGPAFVIAEAGVNHNGDLETAKRLIDVAAGAGADAVKFQAFHAERLVTPSAPKLRNEPGADGPAETQLQMLQRLQLSEAQFEALKAHCRARQVMFLATPFDEESADLLDRLDVPAFKIGSGELTNWPLLAFVARKGRPVILSTGMSVLPEVEAAIDVLRDAGCREIALLHCTSAYPADPRDANLRAIDTLRRAFRLPIGLSDHTLGTAVALAAVALGACVVEKHFTLDRRMAGPDHHASLEPEELRQLVRGIRTVEAALGNGKKEPAAAERETASVARRSLVAARAIPAGTVLTRELVAIKRPGDGLPPSMLAAVIGRRVKVPLALDEPIRLDDVVADGESQV